MNESSTMNQPAAVPLVRVPRNRPSGFALVVALAAFASTAGWGATVTNNMLNPPVPIAGGLSPSPVVVSTARTNNALTVKWHGIQGPYQLQHTTALAGTNTVWQSLGDPVNVAAGDAAATVPWQGDVGLEVVRVQADSPNYVGARGKFPICMGCHKGIYDHWTNTVHYSAFETLKSIHMDKNPSCIPCHTVGYGLPNGFQDEATTPELAGVQCESCHGPAGNHVSNIDDVSVRPIRTVSATVCGGCHTDAHHPTFEEWRDSPHSVVTPDVAGGFATASGAPNEARMNQCGPCHSAAVRVALLSQLDKTNSADILLPTATDAASFGGATCVVCHNPHQIAPEDAGQAERPQLRHPTVSFDNFSFATSTNALNFAAQYNPDIQVCGQCHNLRGGKWADTGRPPHHSPQYNMLIGQGGYDLGVSKIEYHATDTEDQCVTCHVYAYSVASPTEDQPNEMGHTFKVQFEACAECHGSAEGAQAFAEATKTNMVGRINEVVGLLNQWGTTKAPTISTNLIKYGQYSWEFTIPGALSNPNSNPAIVGPSSADQKLVPDGIKQARFNLYMVQHDASFGVHNGEYARWLLSIAKTNVNVELAKP